MMPGFHGEYTCPLDEKFRAVLPQKMRDSIAAERLADGFMLIQGFEEGSLILFPRDLWRQHAARVAAIPFTDPRGRLLKRFFLAEARDVSIDRVGRLAIADFHRDNAGIKREVLFAGVGDYIELWDPGRWRKHKEENLPRYPEVAEAFPSIFFPNPAPAAMGGMGGQE